MRRLTAKTCTRDHACAQKGDGPCNGYPREATSTGLSDGMLMQISFLVGMGLFFLSDISTAIREHTAAVLAVADLAAATVPDIEE